MKKKRFDIEKYLDEVDFDELSPGVFDDLDEPKKKHHAKCPHCGSTDWWKIYRNKYGTIVKCSECD